MIHAAADLTHHLLNAPLLGLYSAYGWDAVRALTVICSWAAGWAARRSRDRFLVWSTLGLGLWISVKISDDFAYPASVLSLTPYFAISNLLWCAVLIGLARMANRERRAQEIQAGGSA